MSDQNADSAPRWADRVGAPLAVGDEVRAVAINPDRGVAMWMNLGRILRFGRTRAVVQFYGANGEWTVGTECLRKVPAGTLAQIDSSGGAR